LICVPRIRAAFGYVVVVLSLAGTTADAANLTGVVRDATGAALPSVRVEAIAAGTLAPTLAITDHAGRYQLESLRPGAYRVVFRLVNFATLIRESVVVEESAPSRLDATLQLALSADVTVTSSDTFVNLAEIEHPEESLVGFAGAASQGAVTAWQLATRPLLRAGEVLETVPGLIISQHSAEGKANQYYLRGFTLDHGTDFATTVAGVPVNMPTHGHGHGYADANFLIPELVSGVQFRKGPYRAEDGDFSAAGSASVSYLNVLNRPIVSVSGGEDGWGRLLAAASPRLGAGYLLAAVEANRNDGPWIRPEGYRRLNAVVRYSRGTSQNGLALTVLGYDAEWDATDQVPARAVQEGLIPRFGLVDESDGGRTSRYSLSFDWQRSDARQAWHATAYAANYSLDLFSNFTYFLEDPDNGDQFEQRDRRTLFGGRVSFRRRTNLLGRRAEHTVGVQLRHDDIGAVGLYKTRARTRLSTVRDDAVAQTSAGMYGQSEVRLTDRVRATVGLRGDLYRFDVAASDPRNSGLDYAELVSPKAGLVLGPWRKTEFYINAGLGFHSNDARGTTIRFDPTTGEPASRVTPLARARGAEVGLRTVLIPHVQTTVTLWRLDLDSELIFVGDAGTTEAGRPSRRYGVEWSAYAKPRSWLTLDLDVSFSSSRFRDDPAGDRIPGALASVVSSGVSVDGRWPLMGSLRWRYFGERPLTEDGSVRSRRTSLFNLDLGYRISRVAQLKLDVFNLFNAETSDIDYFYTSRLPGEPDQGIDDVHFHPSVPRTARLSLVVAF
jgi:TonB dependent receptor/Carboxypeptidase regulatory-like domain/TonB-dependent Receptor Plug Domain